MKKLFSLLTVMAFAASFAFAQEGVEAPVTIAAETSGPEMTFETTEVDYGSIEQNAEPYREFNFTNTGTEPLVIKNAKGSCGCTVPTYPKEPIMPGEAAVIKVRYDTKRIGKFTKTVTLTTNESVEKRVLRIKGQVNKPAAEPEAVPEAAPNPFNNN